MEVKIGQYIDSDYFYNSLLLEICEYAKRSSYDQLILDASETLYINPGVLCNLLSSLHWLRNQGKKPIFIKLGYNPKLHDYLMRTNFFVYSVGTELEDQLAATDQAVVNMSNSDYAEKNTLKIVRVSCSSVAHETNKAVRDIKESLLQAEIYQKLYKYIITIPKIRAMFPGMRDDNIVGLFSGLVENTWQHGQHEKWQQDCYYTFQRYEKAGFSFSISDWGIGFYKSLVYTYTKKNTYGEFIKRPNIFTLKEFLAFESYYQDLAGIIEALCFRINENVPNGLSDILQWYFYKSVKTTERKIRIHSGRILLVINRSFFRQYFVIDENTERIKAARAKQLRDIVFTRERFRDECRKENLVVFQYELPGVHIDANIPRLELEY